MLAAQRRPAEEEFQVIRSTETSIITGAIDTVNLRIAMQGLSVQTQRCYKRWIRTYLMDVIGCVYDGVTIPISDAIPALNPALLRSWLGLLRSRNLGSQSISQGKSAVVWLAQLIADMGRLDYNTPSSLTRVKNPRAEDGQRPGTWLNAEQVRSLLKCAKTASNTPAAGRRNFAMLCLLSLCGLRRDEITKLKWSEVLRRGDFPVLVVHGKGSKRREVKLPDRAFNALLAWREDCPEAANSSTLIFSRITKTGRVSTLSISTKTVRNVVTQAAYATDIPNVAPHDLRRSFARGAYEAGASFELIRQGLGHSNLATTEKYVNATLELENAAADIWSKAVGDDDDDL